MRALLNRLATVMLVRPCEGPIVLYLVLLHLVIALGMTMGRSTSDALFFKRFGVEYLPHMLFLTSLLLVAFSTGYAAFVDRMRPGRMFSLLFIVFAVFLGGVWLAMNQGAGNVAFALYYLGYGVISEILVSHFNLYAMAYFDNLQAKRLFPIISAAARLGAIFGGVAVGLLGGMLQPEDVALVWVALLLLATLLVNLRHRGEPLTVPGRRGKGKGALSDIREGILFARKSQLLKITGLSVFVLLLVISIMDYLASTLFTRHFDDAQSLTSFFGWFIAATNSIVLLLQLFATNRLLRRFGLQFVNLIFPATSIAAFALLSLSASFIPALFARFNYTGLLPAFRIPAANLFYNALPDFMQGRARALMVGLVVPLGMGVSGLLLMLVPKEWVDERLAFFGLILSVVYFILKTRKNQAYGESLIKVIQQQVFSGNKVTLQGEESFTPRIVEDIKQCLLKTEDAEIVLAYSELLAEKSPEQAGPIMLELAPRQPYAIQDRMLPLICRLRPPGWEAYARSCLDKPEQHLRATALTQLANIQAQRVESTVRDWLHCEEPRLMALAAETAFKLADAELAMQAEERLHDMLTHRRAPFRIAALNAIGKLGRLKYLAAAQSALTDYESRVRATALQSFGEICVANGTDAGQPIGKAIRDPSQTVRIACITSLQAMADVTARLEILARGIEDTEKRVRDAVLKHAAKAMPVDVEGYQTALDHYFRHFEMQSLITRNLAETHLAMRGDLLAALCGRHIHEAVEKRWLLVSLQKEAEKRPARADLLRTILSEEIQRHIDIALELLGHLNENTTTDIIRAALASRDRRLRAQAIESVRHLGNLNIVKDLMPLLEDDDATVDHPAVESWRTRSWSDILAWCDWRGSAWLAGCASLMVETPARSA